ncbi:MAG: hypothetical protein U0514_03160 [Candidatus Andersenbacteria bacterium]
MSEADQLRTTLDRQSYAEVPFTVPRAAIEEAVAGFFAFLALPAEVKQRFAYEIKQDERDRGMDLGWRERTSTTRDHSDDKEFFHYNELARTMFEPKLAELTAAEGHAAIVRAFMERADGIYSAALATMQQSIRTLDARYVGLYEQFFPVGARPAVVLRFLKYNRGGDGTFLAKGHYDRSACTLAIAESAPGLRIGRDDQHLQQVEHRQGFALFFPGLVMGRYTRGELKPAWHDVVQDGQAYNAGAARWALVLFSSPPGPIYFTREHHTHTPVRAR